MTTPTPLPTSLSELQFVYIELTVKCNLRCHFCDNDMRNLYKDMPPERFEEIIDQLKPGTRIGLHGLGEPTLHKGLLQMIGWAKERGLYVYFNSNHTVTSEEQMRGFVDLGLDELRISMSAGSRESYQAYSAKDLFNNLVERTYKMVKIRGNATKPRLRIVFVLTEHSYKEFPEVLRIAEHSGVDELQVQSFLNWGKALPSAVPGGLKDIAVRDHDLVMARQTIVQAARTARRVRVILPFPLEDHIPDETPGAAGQCQWPFNAIWITADGHATPCCNIHDHRQMDLGNVFEQPLEYVWLADKYTQFRADYQRNDVTICQSCPVNYGVFKTYTYENEPAAQL